MSRGFWRSAVVAALSVVMGLGLTAPALAAHTRKQPRPLVSTSTPGVGQQLVLAGRLTTHLRRQVRLQRSTGAGWSTVGRTRSTRRGVYVFSTFAPTTPGPVSYRVVAPRKRSHKRVVSRVRRVTVSSTVVSAPGGGAPGGGTPGGGGGGTGGTPGQTCLPNPIPGLPRICVPIPTPPVPTPPIPVPVPPTPGL